MVVHDGFLGLAPWKGFLPGSDVCLVHTLKLLSLNIIT